MRPVYETAANVSAERRVATAFAAACKAQAHKTPKMYEIDWAMHRERLAAWVEVKCRNVVSTQYPTLILSCKKWDAGMRLAERFRVPFILVIGYRDGIFFWKAEDIQLDVGHGGRSDRGDWQDMEPVVHIPIELFTRLGG